MRTVQTEYGTEQAALEQYTGGVSWAAMVSDKDVSISNFVQQWDSILGQWVTTTKNERTTPLITGPPPGKGKPK